MKQTIYVRTKRSKCVGELENSQHDFVRECLASTFFHVGGFGLSWLQLSFRTLFDLTHFRYGRNVHCRTTMQRVPKRSQMINVQSTTTAGLRKATRRPDEKCQRTVTDCDLKCRLPDLIWLHKLLSLLSLLSLVKVFCFVPFESFRLSLENRPQWEVEGSVPPSEKSKGRVFRCQTTCITNCVLCVICVICVACGTGCTKLKGTPESFALRQVVLNLASLQLKIWPSLTIKECTLGSQNNTSTVWNVIPTNK